MLKKTKLWAIVLVIAMLSVTAVGCAPAEQAAATEAPAAAEPAEAPAAEEPAAEAPAAAEPAEAPAAEEPAGGSSVGDASDITIGVSVSDLRLERWQRDLNYMVEAAEALGCTVFSQSADDDEQKQMTQIDAMLTQGCDVIIVIPVNSDGLKETVATAHEDGVPIIAYDRLLRDVDLDYYITFDMVGVGRMQANYLLDLVPQGRYFLMEGDKTDNNAALFYQGQMEVLQPEVDAGNIEIVGEQWADGWLEEEAMKLMEQALTATNNEIDAICDANDSTAAGAIQALAEQGLAGQIPITGQDCDLAACKRVVGGTQTMSVYKPLENLAKAAVELAIKVARGETIQTNGTYPNGMKDVPSINLDIIACDQSNMMETVIADGFHPYDDVYADIPEDERPPQA
jgi:D-xylose transport system substrate-binding protein